MLFALLSVKDLTVYKQSNKKPKPKQRQQQQ